MSIESCTIFGLTQLWHHLLLLWVDGNRRVVDCEDIFTGHYLSACTKMFASTGDERFKPRIDTIVANFEACRAALGDGYLSAFPQSAFDTLEQEFGGGGIWAPYYTIHKILAGLLDAHRHGRSDGAIEVATRHDWCRNAHGQVPSSQTLEPMLRTNNLNPLNEYGESAKHSL